MSDGDSFGRRSGRKPDNLGYTPAWNDDPSLDDTYSEQVPSNVRRPRGARQPQSAPVEYDANGQPISYRPSEPRYPDEQGDAASWNRGGQQQSSWPDRPYANEPVQRPRQAPNPQAPQYRTPYDYEDPDGISEVGQWDEEQPAPRRPQIRRERAPRQPLPRPSIPPVVSMALAGQDSRLLMIVGGSILSLIVMVIVTIIRMDHIADWFPYHIDASGVVTHWATSSALWRLPFALAIMTVMNIAAAFILGLREQRIAWILIGSLPLIHVIAWLALILIAW